MENNMEHDIEFNYTNKNYLGLSLHVDGKNIRKRYDSSKVSLEEMMEDFKKSVIQMDTYQKTLNGK